MVVLDTDHLSLLNWDETSAVPRLWARLQGVDPEIATTIVNYEEQTRGWMAYVARARRLPEIVAAYARLSKHLEGYRRIRVLDFDEAAAAGFDRLRRSRIRIGTQDLKIAAIALAHGATLLSRNLVDFRKVPGLKVEDWTL